jgi:hypothetical protein
VTNGIKLFEIWIIRQPLKSVNPLEAFIEVLSCSLFSYAFPRPPEKVRSRILKINMSEPEMGVDNNETVFLSTKKCFRGLSQG